MLSPFERVVSISINVINIRTMPKNLPVKIVSRESICDFFFGHVLISTESGHVADSVKKISQDFIVLDNSKIQNRISS